MSVATTIERVRRFALDLPKVTEAPHHHMSSYRVQGKIFATVPPGDELLHVFVDDERRALALAMDPDAYENLHWGKKVVGVRVHLERAVHDDVEELLLCAWRRKAPKSVSSDR